MQICQIPHVIFESTSQFSFKIFSAIKNNSSVIFFSSKYIIYFGQRSQLKSKCFRFLNARVKIRQIPHVMSFFIVMTHKSSVNFKLTQFLFWTKESHQSPNFDTFKCSGENLLMSHSSCHFPNHKSVFFKFCTTLQCHES